MVCVVALAWVLWGVTWHDSATTADGREHRLLGQTDTAVTLLMDGGEHDVALDELARNDEDQPKISYGLRSVWQKCNKSILLLCAVLFFPVTPIQSLRFQWMLKAQGIHITWWESMKFCYAGNFFNFATPLGTTGGDVVRAYYVSLHTEHKTEAVVTVFLDRVVGLVSLVLIGLVAMLLKPDDERLRQLSYWAYGVLVLLALGAAVVMSRRIRTVVRPGRFLDRLPMAHQLRRIDKATMRMRERKGLVLACLVLTFVLQIVALASFVVAAKALHMKWSLGTLNAYFAYISGGLVVAAIPISPMGLGTMEAAFKQFFLGTYGNLSQVLYLAMAVRLVQLLWALPGMLVPLMGAHLPPPEKLAQFKEESERAD